MPNNGRLSGLCRVTEHLYVSNGKAAGLVSLLRANNITCVVNVTETKRSGSSHLPNGVEYIHIPLADSPSTLIADHFDGVGETIQRIARGGGRTLVHCNAGVSRSAALCMAFLVKHHSVTLLEAHAWVKTCRPMVRPNNGFWKQLIQYEKELRGCTSVQMVSSSMGEIPDIYEEEARNMMPF
ncbi:dual specificity protein phosphatase 18 [Nerophis lumbriciformis]|uniref:dual specificity protein phosphatase 18 n=1 Tax=Nerophis lumbriciformis TaxID=546530 RepID=UPI002AE02BFE|nr:dual specificity protein phosphatase 18 [Nerophis lumbriciformis]